jgi:hypothetical protein
MKRCCSTVVCFVLFLAFFGFRGSNTFGMAGEEAMILLDSLPVEGDIANEETPIAGAGKISMPSICWDVTVDYEITVKNIGDYFVFFPQEGTTGGQLYLDADTGTGGEYTLTPSGEGRTLVDGAYTLDGKGNIILSPVGIPGVWLEDTIVSILAKGGLGSTIVNGGVDPNVGNTKPSRVTFTKVNGQSLPAGIAPISYQFNYTGADVIINGQEFSNAEIQLNLKITFTKKSFKAITCKEMGSIDIDLSWEMPHPICAKFSDNETGLVTFSLRPQPTDQNNVCEYLGEGKAYHREDWINCVFPDGSACTGNAVCVVGIGVVGRVPNPVSLGCGAGSLLVDFAEVFDCSITGCPMSTLGSFATTFSLTFPYKNNAVIYLPAYSGGVHFKLHLK